MRRTPRQVLLDAEQHRRNAVSFADQAGATSSIAERDHFAMMARTSELLAKNADWLRSIDTFLTDWRPKS
ncbi:hypothetical protein [Rhodoplanes sp. SY1]|uniref:hypothetical protein n=1 Tax=Rhodoplanes sp. SY1 TaxID=3166646 RepID=UPI0038B5B4D8